MSLDHPLAVSPWDDLEIAAAIRVLETGRTTMGREVAKFEERFADYIGTRHAVMVNSGSSANLLMISALLYTGRIQRWARVAVPAIAWSTTLSPLAQFGMRPIVVDVDDSLTMDPSLIPPEVDVVLAVNTLGNPCDYDEFPSRPILLEDNCEALGAGYDGQRTGSIGLMASHSLFFSHHISTMEGGVITTDDDELHHMLLMLRSHGWTRDLPGFAGDFDEQFEFRVPGYNVRPTELQGAIGNAQMRKIDEIMSWRRANGEIYVSEIGHQREIGESSWFGFAAMARDREKVLRALDGSGIETRPILAGNILSHEMMRFFDIDVIAGGTPIADEAHQRGLFVGNHGDMGAVLRFLRGALEFSDAA